MVEFKLEGETFRFPDTRLDTVLQEDKNIKGEISSGFILVGLGEDFKPKTDENIDDFIFNRNKITVSIDRVCPTSAKDTPRSIHCTAERSALIAYDVFALRSAFDGSFIPKDGRPDLSPLQIPGLELTGYQFSPARIKERPDDAQYGVPDGTVYSGVDPDGRVRFAICNNSMDAHSRHCEFHFIWNEKFEIRMRMKNGKTQKWETIWKNIEIIINDHKVTSNTKAIDPGIMVLTYPPKKQ